MKTLLISLLAAAATAASSDDCALEGTPCTIADIVTVKGRQLLRGNLPGARGTCNAALQCVTAPLPLPPILLDVHAPGGNNFQVAGGSAACSKTVAALNMLLNTTATTKITCKANENAPYLNIANGHCATGHRCPPGDCARACGKVATTLNSLIGVSGVSCYNGDANGGNYCYYDGNIRGGKKAVKAINALLAAGARPPTAPPATLPPTMTSCCALAPPNYPPCKGKSQGCFPDAYGTIPQGYCSIFC